MDPRSPAVRRLVTFAVLVTLGLSVAACGAPRGGFALSGGYLWTQGEMGVSDTKSTTGLDDLGLDATGAVIPDLYLGWGGLRVRATGMWLENSGTGEASHDLGTGSEVIPAGDDVRTEMKIVQASGTVTFDLIPGDWLDIGLGGGLGYLDYEFRFRSQQDDTSFKASEGLAFGYLAVHAASDLGIVRLSGDLAGGGDLDKFESPYVEFDGNVGVRLFGSESPVQGWVVGGYRVLAVDLDRSVDGARVRANLRLHGPYLGFRLTF
jgi:hypothetical protein